MVDRPNDLSEQSFQKLYRVQLRSFRILHELFCSNTAGVFQNSTTSSLMKIEKLMSNTECVISKWLRFELTRFTRLNVKRWCNTVRLIIKLVSKKLFRIIRQKRMHCRHQSLPWTDFLKAPVERGCELFKFHTNFLCQIKWILTYFWVPVWATSVV